MTKNNPQNKLELQNVHLFDGQRQLFEINTEIKPGEVLAVMGPSGSGKSSLLNLVSGFLPDIFSFSGQVMLGDQDITHLEPNQRQIGLMFQDPLLFPHLSVEENLLFALPAGGSKKERCEKVFDALDAVGMADLGHRDPLTLSGGQQSRISLVRVLLSEPKALLLDEPFSALDSGLKDKVREFVFSQARSRCLPTLLVTHDVTDADFAQANIIEL